MVRLRKKIFHAKPCNNMFSFCLREKIRNKDGISIIELMISVSAVIVAVLGILTLVSKSLGLNRVNADSHVGAYLAAEGIEVVKNFYDRSYLLVHQNGSGNFYGWGSGVAGGIPAGLYLVDYNDTSLNAISCPQYSGGPPTQAVVEDILTSCNAVRYLKINNFGLYSNDVGGVDTRFKRIVIVYDPYNGTGNDLDYSVTSAVGWESRGGKYFVQLQDHFLPWRTP